MNEIIGLLEGTWQNTLILSVMVWTKPHEKRCPGQGTQAPSHAPAHPCACRQKATAGPGWHGHPRAAPGAGMLSGHAAARHRRHGHSAVSQGPGGCGRGCFSLLLCLRQETHGGRHPWPGLLCSCCRRVLPGCGRASAGSAPVLCRQSRVPGTHDGALPFTPLCVLPDFGLALTSACSLDPRWLRELPQPWCRRCWAGHGRCCGAAWWQAKARCSRGCRTVLPESNRSLHPLSGTCQQRGTRRWLCRACGVAPPPEPGTPAGVSGARWFARDAGEVRVSLPGSSAFPH